MQHYKILVCGAGGFIGHHLVNRLVSLGHFVRGIDLKYPMFTPTKAQDFIIGDLRDYSVCERMLFFDEEYPEIDHVFQFAADMGGMGFISSNESDILTNNILINSNVARAVRDYGAHTLVFSSSVCVYPDMLPGDPVIFEEDAIPANPDNEYGWEKLYSEKLFMSLEKEGLCNSVKIARFQNCYGPLGTWRGGREKAPAAICRKVAEAKDGQDIEIWGDGSAVRPFIHVSDLIDGIMLLFDSDISTPVNIGPVEGIPISTLAETIIDISGKDLRIKYVPGPVGVHDRKFDNSRIRSLGWEQKISFRQGMEELYRWVEAQTVNAGYE